MASSMGPRKESWRSRILDILKAPKPPANRPQYDSIIPLRTRIWRAIRLPSATNKKKRTYTPQQKRLIRYVASAAAVLLLAWGTYSYVSGAQERSMATYQAGMSALGPGDFELAVSLFTDAIATWGGNARAYLERGNAHNQLGNTQQAFADWERAIEIDPDLWEAYTARGTKYRVDGNLEAALRDLSRSIEIQPNVDAYYQRAHTYNALQNYNAAVDDYTRAILERPNAPYVYAARAMARRATGDESGYAADIEEAARIEQRNR